MQLCLILVSVLMSAVAVCDGYHVHPRTADRIRDLDEELLRSFFGRSKDDAVISNSDEASLPISDDKRALIETLVRGRGRKAIEGLDVSNERPLTSESLKRVVVGTPMEREQWPWLVSLHFLKPIVFTEKSGMQHVCGGTIINADPLWVLTAGHCFSEEVHEGFANPNNWDVIIGEYNQYQKDDTEVKAHIEQIHLHENFSVNTLLNDVALLKLRPVKDFHVEDAADLDMGEFPVGQQCSVAGWGQVSYHPYGWGMFIPLITSVSLVSNDACVDMYAASKTQTFFIDQSTICAGSDEGHDSCLGDSGGPLMCQSPDDSRWKLVGVVSTGNECGLKEFPGIYTRVSYFREWMEHVMHTHNAHLEM